jgi:thiamine kinase-like enzyme
MPREVSVLKTKRNRKRGVYRLDGAGPGGAPVIAKVCRNRVAEVESIVYEELLPRLGMPSLDFYGKLRDSDREHSWLFLEDAGPESYLTNDDEHRRLAARWLAKIHLHANEVLRIADLPDRGPRHYLVHLLSARNEVVRQLRRQDAESRDAMVLEDLLSRLDVIEARWGEVANFCDTLPLTLVHGDFVPRNLRVREDGLVIFDWETAGLGVQAPDLAKLLETDRYRVKRKRFTRASRFSANPCLDTYRAAIGECAPAPDAETVEQSAAIGSLFRCIAALDWTCSGGTVDWCPIDAFHVDSALIGDAMQLAGLPVPDARVRPPGPASYSGVT